MTDRIPGSPPLPDDQGVAQSRQRAALVAAIAGLALLPYFLAIAPIAGFHPVSPPLGSPAQEFVDFYVANASRIPLNVTLFIGQWVIQLVLLVGIVRAACRRVGVGAIVAIAVSTAATAIYVGAEGVLLWPVLASDMSAEKLRTALDPQLAAAAVLSRDGLHAPAGVLLGVALLVIAGLLGAGDLWGHWAMSGLALLVGAVALSSVLVGPQGLGPGLIFVLWAPVTGVLLLVGRRRVRARPQP